MLEIFERHGVAEMLRRSLTDAAPEDIIREITQDRVTSIGEIDDTVLSMIRITEEQARKRQKQKEELRIEFLKSIRWFGIHFEEMLNKLSFWPQRPPTPTPTPPFTLLFVLGFLKKIITRRSEQTNWPI